MALTTTKNFQKYYNNLYMFIRNKTKITMGDPLDHATGLEKREMLAKLSGNTNPFDLRMIKRGPGTKDEPTEIPSAFGSRIIGCICHHDATAIFYMWLHNGHPKRCECGHWFKLVYKAPV
ncbi:hypothetical protein FQR65_LT18052 [Abscondita terminalis]|nr:hypothetical protein FQR65_LT18052 [Abscondita terminalis]